MWYLIELPRAAALTEIEFESPPRGGGRGGASPAGTYPRAYQLQLSEDGRNWGPPAAEGNGNRSPMAISFAPARAKFIRITLTATVPDAPAWTMRNIRVLEAIGNSQESGVRR
jgi:hypothetical protein